MTSEAQFRVVNRVPTSGEYAALRASVGWVVPHDEQSEVALRHSIVGVCAETEDSVAIGMARVVGDRMFYWYLQDLVVRPDWQGLGVGRAILELIEAEVTRLAVVRTALGLVTGGKEVGFYARMGYAAQDQYMSRTLGD